MDSLGKETLRQKGPRWWLKPQKFLEDWLNPACKGPRSPKSPRLVHRLRTVLQGLNATRRSPAPRLACSCLCCIVETRLPTETRL